MKIKKAEIYATLYIAKVNEPYNTDFLKIEKIIHYYADGGFDEYMNSYFGNIAEDEFYAILHDDCEVKLHINTKIFNDKYYDYKSFKQACYNKCYNNPYQLPNYTKI